MRIGQLAQLPLPGRARWITAHHEPALGDALARAAAQGLTGARVTAAELAWALAFNLAEPPDAATGAGGGGGGGKILGRRTPAGETFAADAPFALLWGALTRPRHAGQTSWLAELAWSVACECRPDWLPPDAAVPAGRPERSFNALLKRCHDPVLASLRHRYHRALPREEIQSCANLAWAQVYHAYWSPLATRRFLGLVTVRSFVIAVAVKRAQDQLRLPGACGPAGPAAERARPGPVSLLDDLPPAGALGNFFRWHRREVDLTAAILELPAHQALYSYCYHSGGLSQKQLAGAFRCSRANVCKALSQAWQRLVRCPRLRAAFDELA